MSRAQRTDRAARAILIALIAGAGLACNAQAEDLYVIEQLVIGVATTPDGAGERVASIRSGDRVEVLERQTDYVRVKLRTGAEGWVKASYLSSEPPLRQRLEEQTAQLEQAREQVTRLEAELAEVRAAAASPQASPASMPESSGGTSLPVATAAAAEAQSVASAPASTGAPPMLSAPRSAAYPAVWQWALGSSTVALIAGFVLGWRMLDRRIRRKYGGLRIY